MTRVQFLGGAVGLFSVIEAIPIICLVGTEAFSEGKGIRSMRLVTHLNLVMTKMLGVLNGGLQ
jgi:hypothetical protein